MSSRPQDRGNKRAGKAGVHRGNLVSGLGGGSTSLVVPDVGWVLQTDPVLTARGPDPDLAARDPQERQEIEVILRHGEPSAQGTFGLG